MINIKGWKASSHLPTHKSPIKIILKAICNPKDGMIFLGVFILLLLDIFFIGISKTNNYNNKTIHSHQHYDSTNSLKNIVRGNYINDIYKFTDGPFLHNSPIR